MQHQKCPSYFLGHLTERHESHINVKDDEGEEHNQICTMLDGAEENEPYFFA